MTKAERDRLQSRLFERFGLSFRVTSRTSAEGDVVELAPMDLHPVEGFCISVVRGWRSVRAELAPGRFARDLLLAMGHADVDSKGCFQAITAALSDRRLGIEFAINGAIANPKDPAHWPSDWQSVTLAVLGSPFDPTSAATTQFAETLVVAEGAVALVLSLAADSCETDGQSEPDTSTEGFPEGAVLTVRVNRYERDRRNRGLCIAALGARCRVCDFDFEREYGSLGAGFIHVHHIVPLSRMESSYTINPVRDLVPVCANCHAMIHRHDPPLAITELQALLSSRLS